MTFSDLKLSKPLLHALTQKGYSTPTPIQQQAIPKILEGKDLFGCAQTGTGKTAAFALPILQLLAQSPTNNRRNIRALILAPTRELALQIHENIVEYARHLPVRYGVVYGGVSQNAQVQQLKKGIDLLVATPGRLLDLQQQGFLSLQQVEFFVLDEADKMLDMGFIRDIRKVIASLPAQRQSLFFSATTTNEIKNLAATILYKPESIAVTPVSSTTELIKQFLYYVPRENKRGLLEYVLKNGNVTQALVFTRTKRGADKVARTLSAQGWRAESIHGNKSQGARVRALDGFKKKNIDVLVATDIAARGIDVENLSHVINYELPEVAETYVHRIGRTGRAGANGIALSFCTEDETDYLKGIHQLTKIPMEVIARHPFSF
ncbi:MAG TPA: DEAD/DEAH box helicase [Saprospiraceae bacterium]|nr:DEAD/DEAH box helicase [Lewinellaceae bacterium]HPR01781.1 DEAD/DEAH box helicase [Saprospiraceae bacterium]HRV85450.1 DEAD/DEAH box helicase [Saprospiraceae bacterium]